MFSITSEVSSKLMYQHYVNHVVVQYWLHKVWERYIPLSYFFLRRLPLDCTFRKLGISLASRCHLCEHNSKDLNHIFVTCPFAYAIYVIFRIF